MKNINIDFLKKCYSDDNELIIQLLSIFNDMSNEFMYLTEDGIKNSNYEEIEIQSHKFGSSCQMLGLTILYEQIKFCELTSISKSNMTLIEKQFDEIKTGLHTVKNEIDIIVNALNVV